MEITQVRIRMVEMNKVRALASVTFDDQFVVHDLRVVETDEGSFVAMPSRKLPNNVFRDIAHPIESGTRNMIQDAVLEEYRRVVSGSELAGGAEEAPAKTDAIQRPTEPETSTQEESDTERMLPPETYP